MRTLSSRKPHFPDAAGQHLFGAINPAQFLKRYWQKRPLLVRGAFPGFRDPVSRDELAGLSCESDVESRLIMERGGAKPWQVILGPQRAAQLRLLPPSHWTLLVQHVDRYVPGVASLLDSFRFIPDWRIEDVMISFAPRGGSVGAHVDSYDVFLLQGQGRRRWRLDSKAPAALRQGLDLRILQKFNAEEDSILEPGDMLYLPPGLAHYGVALEECLTYSIGFRAPSAMELLTAAHDRLTQSDTASQRYRDPGLQAAHHPGEIPRAALKELRTMLEKSLHALSDAGFDALVGELVTESKGAAIADGHRINAATLRGRLKKGGALVRSPGTRLGFLSRGKTAELYANGRRFPLTRALAFAGPLLTGERRFSNEALSSYLKKSDFVELLATLVSAGAFQVER
jgi:50S ribosomal protein L16 3-hydroxylase